MASYNKDFYNKLPGMVCISLDSLIKKYGKEPWFPKAWNEYRSHVNRSSMNTVKMPGYVFKKYIKQGTTLAHHGILGQKWGIRRWQNEDGSLTPAGYEHYYKKDVKWAKKNYQKINKEIYSKSKQELNDYVENDLNKRISMKTSTGKLSLEYVNDFNRKMAEVMTKNASDLKTPNLEKAVKFVAKRQAVGVEMIISDEGYDISQLKNGIYSSGRIAYKKKEVNRA